MAVDPDRRDLNQRKTEIRDVDRSAPYVGRGWFAWWWVWFIIIVGFIGFAGWGWGGYGGWLWGPPRGVFVQPLTTGSGVALLTSDNKRAFIGQSFNIRDVLVRNRVNDRVLWIAANNTAPILVVCNAQPNPSANANHATTNSVTQGSRVDVTGIVEKAPPAAQSKREWNLSDSGAQRLEQQGAYVQGSLIQKAIER